MSDQISILDSSSFQTDVIDSGRPTLVDFSATWCGPCKQLLPIIEDLASEFRDRVQIAKIDLDENQEIAVRYGVQAVPSLLFFRGGEVVDRLVGVHPRAAIAERLEALGPIAV